MVCWRRPLIKILKQELRCRILEEGNKVTILLQLLTLISIPGLVISIYFLHLPVS